MSDIQLDAEALYLELRQGVRRLLQPETRLVGVWSGAPGWSSGCSETWSCRANMA